MAGRIREEIYYRSIFISSTHFADIMTYIYTCIVYYCLNSMKLPIKLDYIYRNSSNRAPEYIVIKSTQKGAQTRTTRLWQRKVEHIIKNKPTTDFGQNILEEKKGQTDDKKNHCSRKPSKGRQPSKVRKWL